MLTLVKEFHLNSTINLGILFAKVKGQILKLNSFDINHCLGLPDRDLKSLEEIDIEKTKKIMQYKRNPSLKDMKKKEFPEEFEFLAKIVGKCILCKDAAHDTVIDQQLKIMSAIVLKEHINFGAILLDQMSKWLDKEEKKRLTEKPLTKVFHGRFLSIILKKKLNKIKDDEGEILNVYK